MSREARVGLLLTISIILFIGALYFLGSIQEMITYRIKFDNVNGLTVDSPVHYNGVPIGRVTKIVLSDEPMENGRVPIIVEIAVHRSAKKHIRASTVADIKSIGVLGDKYILLVTKDYTAPFTDTNAFIPQLPNPLDVEKLLEQGTHFVDDVGVITDRLKIILAKLTEGDGVIQRMINDPNLAQDLKHTVSQTLEHLQNEDSMLGLMLQDKAFAAHVKHQSQDLLDHLTAILKTYHNSNGLLPALMNDSNYKNEIKAQMTALMNSLNEFARTLNSGRGLLYRLSQDEAYGQRVSANLEKASFHLASILEKIDAGEGSASLLLNDPSLYDGVYEIVYGIQNSGISKWYLQRKRKKGSKLIEQTKLQQKDSK